MLVGIHSTGMMPMQGKIFIDTNVVIYSLGQESITKAHIAAPLFVGYPTISTQVISETANVASKRLGLSILETRKLITSLEEMCRVEIISLATIHTALDIRERYGFSWYDSLIVAHESFWTQVEMAQHQLGQNMLDLLRPIYEKIAAYGHFGREEPEFTWERTDKAAALRTDAGFDK